MNKNQFILIEIILLGFIIAIFTMYLIISKVIYEIKNDTMQIIKDHRTMTCTLKNINNQGVVICSPIELNNINSEETSSL